MVGTRGRAAPIAFVTVRGAGGGSELLRRRARPARGPCCGGERGMSSNDFVLFLLTSFSILLMLLLLASNASILCSWKDSSPKIPIMKDSSQKIKLFNHFMLIEKIYILGKVITTQF